VVEVLAGSATFSAALGTTFSFASCFASSFKFAGFWASPFVTVIPSFCFGSVWAAGLTDAFSTGLLVGTFFSTFSTFLTWASPPSSNFYKEFLINFTSSCSFWLSVFSFIRNWSSCFCYDLLLFLWFIFSWSKTSISGFKNYKYSASLFSSTGTLSGLISLFSPFSWGWFTSIRFSFQKTWIIYTLFFLLRTSFLGFFLYWLAFCGILRLSLTWLCIYCIFRKPAFTFISLYFGYLLHLEPYLPFRLLHQFPQQLWVHSLLSLFF